MRNRRERRKRAQEDEIYDNGYYYDDYEEARRRRHRWPIRILNIVYAAVLIFEAVLCGKWLIMPLVPVISDLSANHGVPTISAGSGSDPLSSVTIMGMDPQSLGTLLLYTFFRVIFFAFLFWLTPKLYRLIRRLILKR